MRVLLVLGRYLPGKTAGIENYSHFLATLLLENNHQVNAAILNSDSMEPYTYEGVHVIPLKNGLDSFASLLQEQHYDICHFQEYSGENGININWFTTAKQFCKKVFFTFHLPYLTCYKNDFRYLGIEDCNTFNDAERCTRCVIADKGGYKKMGESNLYLSSLLALMKITGKKHELTKKIIKKYQKLNELIAICDNVFIYASWFKKILEDNGYDLPNIKKIPYKNKSGKGFDLSFDVLNKNGTKSTVKNKILFVGRLQYQKGLHLLCKAMKHVETKEISLDVYGNIVDQKYFEQCKKDYSFNFKGTTNYFHLLEFLKDYDFLVLPSVFTEMSSLIVKDAFYERLPVIASAAKGNVDAITDGGNGFLFDYDDSDSLRQTIEKAYRLKNDGWVPVFKNAASAAKDLDEILSYYTQIN